MRQRQSINGLGLILVALIVLFIANGLTGPGQPETLTQQEYMQAAEAGDIASALAGLSWITPSIETGIPVSPANRAASERI